MTTAGTDKAEQLLDQLHDGIAELTTSTAWTAWLDVARTFHTYSVNNTILIWSQRPDATHVAGYQAWRRLGRQVRKGERGLRILAPMTGKITDDDTGEERRIIRGFRPVAVFDITQTDGDPLPEAPSSPSPVTPPACSATVSPASSAPKASASPSATCPPDMATPTA